MRRVKITRETPVMCVEYEIFTLDLSEEAAALVVAGNDAALDEALSALDEDELKPVSTRSWLRTEEWYDTQAVYSGDAKPLDGDLACGWFWRECADTVEEGQP